MTVTHQTSTLAPEPQVNQYAEWIRKLGLALVALICGLFVFVLGTSYYDRFATNTSGFFKIGTSVVLLVSALYFRKNERMKPYWRLVYAFFVASMVNVVTWYTAIYVRDEVFQLINRIGIWPPYAKDQEYLGSIAVSRRC